MGILNNDRLSYLSRNLSNTINNASNVKVSNSSHGNKLDTVMDSLVEKADNVTKALEQKITNTSAMFRVGVGNVDVSPDVQDGFSNVGLQGNTLILDANNNEVALGTEGARLASVGDLQEDGKYKIEILSTGKNLFPVNTVDFFATGSQNPVRVTLFLSSEKEYFYTYKSEGISVRNYIFYPDGSKYTQLGYFYGKTKINVPYSGFYTIEIGRSSAEYNKQGTMFDIQLEIGAVGTSYEPHKSNKTQILLDEPLRKINDDIYDELLDDGTLIRRCGEVVLDGSEVNNLNTTRGWYLTSNANTNTVRFRLENFKKSIAKTNSAITNTFIVATNTSTNTESLDWSSSSLTFRILKTRLNTWNSVDDFKTWLSQNPVTVVYELATPVITKLNPAQVRLFKDGHISINSTITPASTHTVLLNKSAQIENSIIQSQSLNSRVDELEGLYDNMILETSYKLANLDFDFSLLKGGE